jgi:hypothetical protein
VNPRSTPLTVPHSSRMTTNDERHLFIFSH